MTQRRFALHRPALLLCLPAAATLISACAPLLVGGAVVGTSMVVTDRRTSARSSRPVHRDQGARRACAKPSAKRGHVTITSYNRNVLLTGEVAATPTRPPSSRRCQDRGRAR